MNKSTAVIVLNRNLPVTTDRLCEKVLKHSSDIADVFVVEAGSDKDKLSKYCTWWVNTEDVKKNGLRVPRGFNYGLSKLYNEGKFDEYEYYFLLTNDAEFEDVPFLHILIEEIRQHPKVGILSPCSRSWGEKFLLKDKETKYFWYAQNVAYLIRREYIEAIMNAGDKLGLSFLYDGTNFRGYCADLELIVKGYANDWATAITTKAWSEENESHLKDDYKQIKTESFDENLRLYVEEGRKWLRSKYGFNSHWTMQMYSKFFYDRFFEYFPELKEFKIK